jgi:hypothetical protein
MTQIETIMALIATRAAAQPVRVEVRQLGGAYGRVEMHGGKLLLLLEEGLMREYVLDVFLHELSHVKHDAALLIDQQHEPLALALCKKYGGLDPSGIERRTRADTKRWARRIRKRVPDSHGLAKQLAWLLENIGALR